MKYKPKSNTLVILNSKRIDRNRNPLMGRFALTVYVDHQNYPIYEQDANRAIYIILDNGTLFDVWYEEIDEIE